MTSQPELRSCIKCGREILGEESVCQLCNRAGMATPSATQYHGTIAAAIVIAVAGLAFAASLSLQGVGPYRATLQGVTPAEPGYTIAYAVTNEGSKPGRAKCQLTAVNESGRQLRTVHTLTAQIPGGETSRESFDIPGLEEEPADVLVACS